MNPRIQKLSAEIGKITSRIAHLQTRLKELEQQRGELENTEIIEMVRSVTATPEELAAFIRAFRANAGATLPEHVLSGYSISGHRDETKDLINNRASQDSALNEMEEPENE
jgi:peptidoglycan hydrolase CwlO-like protein